MQDTWSDLLSVLLWVRSSDTETKVYCISAAYSSSTWICTKGSLRLWSECVSLPPSHLLSNPRSLESVDRRMVV
jgi:hypothetical protein